MVGLTKTPVEFDVAPPVENPPAAVQDVAFVELHVRVEDPPLLIALGLAESVAVGRGDDGAVTVTLTGGDVAL